ncbi:MAG: polyprenyl synthetase family protein [Alphaproteobacteria bacterium]|nr:polyprenyl synthetase family protein [Alphaproteobacteria bacterium]
MSRLKEAMRASAAEVNAALDGYIPRSSDSDGPLFDAMRYSTLAGGKRLRPFLVLNSAALFEVPPEWAMPSAAAIEMVHTYSLVHDDLPTMDDDDLRRGQPTCHKKFDEATAILAGDSLLTLAFELAAAPDGHPDPAVRAEIVHSLAIAAGGVGMAGGQMMDLAAAEGDLDLAAVTRLQERKTGALFRFSCTAGAILAKRQGAEREALGRYADNIGLAFQIADDLLDVEGSESDLGKAVGKDAAAGKATFVDLLGREQARLRATQLAEDAVMALAPFGEAADLLRDVARYIVARRN